MNARLHQRGMTLAELMIAMALGLMLTLGIASLFIQTRTSFTQDEQISTMQANMRFAMEALVRDVAMAGFWGGVLNPANNENDGSLAIAAGGDCGAGATPWLYDINTASISGLNDATSAAANAAHACIAADEYATRTDLLALKRTVAFPIMNTTNNCPADFNADDGLEEGTVYLSDNGVNSILFRHPKASGELEGCVENRLYRPVVYYIRNFSITEGDGIPTLCRKVLDMSGTPSMATAAATECLVEGIEQLQVQYGVDSNANGVANTYLSAPSAAQFAQVTSVRLHILARSIRAQPGYTNNKTYVLGDRSITPADSFYRRSATTTVLLRNPANLRNLVE